MNRIITVFIAVFFGVLLLSCSKNDDKENSTNNPLIGTWYLIEVEGEPTLNDCQKESFYKVTESKMFNKYFYGNKEDGGCKLNFEAEYTYTLLGNEIKVSSGNESQLVPFEIKDGVLSISIEESKGKFYKEKYVKK